MDKKIALKELKSIIEWLEQLDCDVLEGETFKELVDKLVNLVSYYQAAIIKNDPPKNRLFNYVENLTFTRQPLSPKEPKKSPH